MRISSLAGALLATMTLAPGLAHAINDDEVNRVLQFNFSNPGARSLALGGAFTGLADDATAAYANPAGLTILRTQEFGLEVRHSSFDTPYASGGRVVNNPFDSSGVGTDSLSQSVTQPSFASWVYPTERATFALYYHRAADFEGRVAADPIEFVNANGNPTDQYLSASGRIGFQIENFGAAAGFKVSDRFSLGLSLAYSDFNISSRSQRSFDLGAPPFSEQRQSGSDHDLVYTLGAMWQLNSQWNLGLAYRSGGSFSYRASNVILNNGNRLDFTPDFNVPQVFSAGLAFRPSDVWLFTLDLNRIEYSRLSDNVESVFNNLSAPKLSIDDGTEIRVGAEYALIELSTPLFLRAGVWRDPDHRLAYDGARPSNCTTQFDDCLAATLYTRGSDETHYSAGLGWAFAKGELNFAADWSSLVDTYTVSGVIRF